MKLGKTQIYPRLDYEIRNVAYDTVGANIYCLIAYEIQDCADILFTIRQGIEEDYEIE